MHMNPIIEYIGWGLRFLQRGYMGFEVEGGGFGRYDVRVAATEAGRLLPSSISAMLRFFLLFFFSFLRLT